MEAYGPPCIKQHFDIKTLLKGDRPYIFRRASLKLHAAEINPKKKKTMLVTNRLINQDMKHYTTS